MSETTTATVPCWITRYEAEGFDDWTDWYDAHEANGVDVLECTHPEHLNAPEDAGGGGWGHPHPACRWNTAHAMCDLDEGHDGPHEFTPQHSIVLTFAQPRGSAAGER